MAKITKQTIKDAKGKVVAIVLPIEEYNLLIEAYEELEDIKAADAADAEDNPAESISLDAYLESRKLNLQTLSHA
jgi:hypothetical protein